MSFVYHPDNVSVIDIRNSLVQNVYLKLEGSGGRGGTKRSRHCMDNRIEGQGKNKSRRKVVKIAGIQISSPHGQEVW